jgi:hypothetical protein
MPDKHPNASRTGGPGASHENRQQPEKSQAHGVPPADEQSPRRSHVSGGGGEADSHHTHEPMHKGKGAPKGKPGR